MGIEYESVVDHPLAEVFAWHTRPGAMTRLVPPWQPMKVVAETQSPADGRAVLGLPAGLRWQVRGGHVSRMRSLMNSGTADGPRQSGNPGPKRGS
jgi:ligand-binding SRPBCC domain-containing protein